MRFNADYILVAVSGLLLLLLLLLIMMLMVITITSSTREQPARVCVFQFVQQQKTSKKKQTRVR